MTNMNNFCNDLLKLCKKHKVNIECGSRVSTHDNKTYEIELTGMWDIRKEYDALVADEIEQSVKNTIKIKGTVK